MFQRPQASPPVPGMSAAPAAPQAEGEFTRMMRSPAPSGGVLAPPPQSGPADADLFGRPGPSVPVAAGPSFTQVINTRPPAPPAAAAPAAAPKEPAPAAGKPPYLVLGIVLGLVLVLLIALILILVLAKH